MSSGQEPQRQSQSVANASLNNPQTSSTMQQQSPPPNPSSAPSPLTKADKDTMPASKVRYIDTAAAYDLWSTVYDTDGNFLQALDTIEMQTLLPRAISMLSPQPQSQHQPADEAAHAQPVGLKAVDLGCGTGRNTLQLLSHETITDIVGLELSAKMLDIAQQRCTDALLQRASTTNPNPTLSFHQFNMLTDTLPPTAHNVDLVISTLVLEHIPLQPFFATATSMLRPGGLLLLTNMHSDMGRISQAGFVDPKTGEKIRPTSYAHTVGDTMAAAEKAGLELVGDVKEVGVTEELADVLGERAKKWIGIKVWFGGIWRRGSQQ
ncbi:hypothetical protein PMZ80_010791 [Knufia obscura]|uniref:Methyltransferase type 11 domain-containing protein n=2 Tax=Knufia TaxID=430999 RepID=A0AAN8E9J3_9EURO|nr:hypothetical protein PMZ80_010791 [Knufia obscura]KAK5949829.1 hypothetical protein OHC33_009218 [Knufia fluminis]